MTNVKGLLQCPSVAALYQTVIWPLAYSDNETLNNNNNNIDNNNNTNTNKNQHTKKIIQNITRSLLTSMIQYQTYNKLKKKYQRQCEKIELNQKYPTSTSTSTLSPPQLKTPLDTLKLNHYVKMYILENMSLNK